MNTKLDRNILKGAIASNFLFVFVVQPSLNFGVSFKITVKLENKRFVPKINHRHRQPPLLLKHTYMYIQTTKTNFTFDKNDRLQPPQHRHHWYCHHFSHSLFRLCFAPFFISLRLKWSDENKVENAYWMFSATCRQSYLITISYKPFLFSQMWNLFWISNRLFYQ